MILENTRPQDFVIRIFEKLMRDFFFEFFFF